MIKNFLFALLLLLLFPLVYVHAQDTMQVEKAYISFLAGNVDVDYTPDNEMEDFEIAELDMRLPAGQLFELEKTDYVKLPFRTGAQLKSLLKLFFKLRSFPLTPKWKRRRVDLISYLEG